MRRRSRAWRRKKPSNGRMTNWPRSTSNHDIGEGDIPMQHIARRRVLQLSGAGAVSAATGGLAGILASGRAPAFAQGTTLHWVRGSDYVPVSDQTLRTKINELAQKDLGLKINLEGVDGLTIQARVTSAVSSGSGPD